MQHLTMSQLGSKRGWSSSSEQASTTTTDAETISVYMNAGEAAATVKRVKAQECCSMEEAAPSFSFVWEHAVKTPLPGQLQQQLQPADSSTTHTFAGLGALGSNNCAGNAWRCDVLQQADQMDCDSTAAAAAGSSGLVRTSSAPELLKLAQADSAAWQAMHAAGGPGTQQQSALLSHHNYWLT